MDNVLEVRGHAPARSDAEAIDLANPGTAIPRAEYPLELFYRYNGATIVIGTADRKSDHIVGTRLERSCVKKAGRACPTDLRGFLDGVPDPSLEEIRPQLRPCPDQIVTPVSLADVRPGIEPDAFRVEQPP